MESYPRKKKDEGCSPQLLDLISKEREWLLKMKEDRCRVTSEEKKLELCLGPPGGDNWTSNDVVSKFNSKGNDQQTLLSFAPTTNTTSGTKRGFTDTVNGGSGSSSPCQSQSHHVFSHSWSNSGYQGKAPQLQQSQQTKISSSSSSFLQLQSTSQCLPPPPLLPSPLVMSKESSQRCCNEAIDLQQQSTDKKKAFSPPSAAAAAAANTAVPNSSAQKRTAPAAVVGWPPIRSFRKNLASSSSLSKPSPESSSNNKVAVATNEKPAGQSINQKKGMFVKINMDGVPIGRKVDLKSIESYEKLSSAVDELFRGLLVGNKDVARHCLFSINLIKLYFAYISKTCEPFLCCPYLAQGDTFNGGGIQKNKGEEGEKVITGLLDGSGEYTLVYEDNEGDRMLVGDVPWHMFVSTVKRLRVLKSSEISTLCRAGSKQGKISLEDGSVK